MVANQDKQILLCALRFLAKVQPGVGLLGVELESPNPRAGVNATPLHCPCDCGDERDVSQPDECLKDLSISA
jgi:hypothetical protein